MMGKTNVLIDEKQLKHTLESFAEFGKTENNGVTRLALSEEDLKARRYFCSLCEKLGMTVTFDDMGNLYARLAGKEKNALPIVMGSHLDSVEKGGRFDGVLGVVAGIEVVRVLVKNGIEPQVPIIVANMTNEEGARFEPSMMASGVLSGKFYKDDMLKSTDKNGITFEEALEKSNYKGLERNRLKEAEAFLELHIEQGPVLERECLNIGIVECVVGMVCYEIEVVGDSNHAGTTPMSMRKDALLATTSLISEIRQKMARLDNNLVYTIGRMNVYPNIHTVIPNRITFSVESRHQNESTMKQVEAILQDLPHYKEQCKIYVKKLWGRDTVWFNKSLVHKVKWVTKSLGYSYKRMASGAGHDAQFIGTYIPTAMLFVPSVSGKSHSEDEWTELEDCVKGANVLLHTILNLACNKR